jgi:hypothetical protein
MPAILANQKVKIKGIFKASLGKKKVRPHFKHWLGVVVFTVISDTHK